LIVAVLTRAAGVLAWAAVALWAVGASFTDRYLWSQFLWWVPHVVLLAATIPDTVLTIVSWFRASQDKRRRRTPLRLTPFALLFLSLLSGDIGIGAWDPVSPGLRVVQWNASWPGSLGGEQCAARLLALKPDIAVVSNPYKILADGRDDQWRAEGYDLINLGVFLVASRLPILEARIQYSLEGRVVALVRTVWRGESLTAIPIDLPSSAGLGRMQMASDLAEALSEQFAMADIVLGDLNIPRGSASLARLAPTHRGAWEEAGIGWGASWPRALPLLQIDHVLLGPKWRATQARFIDLGQRTHRAQEVTIVPVDPSKRLSTSLSRP
jgi:hypothetical protein